MSLLVFLTFLSLITNQYVPVWMKDSEAGHMGEALGQIGNFKSNIDVQILAAQTAAAVGRHYIPVTTFSSIKLGVDGVPIFSQPTQGLLQLDQAKSPWTVWFRYSISGNNTTVPEATCSCGGNVVLSVFNQFYPQQSIAYENGALIRAQSDGQVVRGEPAFQVFVTNASVQVDFTLVQMFGAGGVSGTTSEGLQARVIAVDLQAYQNIKTAVFLNETGDFGPAWYRFFNNTLATAYGVTAADYKKAGYVYSETYSGSKPTQLRADNPIFLVQSLWNTVTLRYDLTLQFKTPGVRNGVTVLPISIFRLQHAFVNVATGTRGNQLGI